MLNLYCEVYVLFFTSKYTEICLDRSPNYLPGFKRGRKRNKYKRRAVAAQTARSRCKFRYALFRKYRHTRASRLLESESVDLSINLLSFVQHDTNRWTHLPYRHCNWVHRSHRPEERYASHRRITCTDALDLTASLNLTQV